MAASFSIEEMTVPEKLAAIEALWNSLENDSANVPSPPWHGDVLLAREKSVCSGAAAFQDWEECKTSLRRLYP